MSSPISPIYRIATVFSFYEKNDWWRESLSQSLLIKPLLALTGSIRAASEAKGAVSRIGSLLQNGSMLVAVLLIFCLGLPQFANDKLGLAFISLAGLLLWLTGWMLGGKERRKPDFVDFLILLYLGINVVAAFASHYFLPSIKGLAKVIIYIGSYFLFSALCAQSRKRSSALVGAASMIGMALSLHGLYQFKTGVAPLATWEDPTVETQGTRIYSTLGNPNLLAGFLIPLAPLSLGLASTYLVERKWLLSALFYGGFALISLATVLTGSRGGYIAIAAVLATFFMPALLYVWRHKPRSRPFMVIALLATLALGAFAVTQIPSFSTRLESIFAGREHSSNSYRINVWESSFEMFKDNWWFGTGVGNETFRLAYGLYMVSGYDALGTYCVPLEVAVECGVFGLALFVLIIAAVLCRAHMNFWRVETGPYRWVILGCAAAIFGLMTHGLVDTVFYRPQVHFIFWMIVGILTMGYCGDQSAKDSQPGASEIKPD